MASLARQLAKSFSTTVITGFPNYPSGKIYPGYRLRASQREPGSEPVVQRVALYPSHDRSIARRALNYCSFAISATAFCLFSPLARARVVYVYHPPLTAALPALALKALTKTPFVLHVQDLWPDSVVSSGFTSNRSLRLMIDRALGAMCRLVYTHSSHIVVISEGFKRELIQRGVEADKISVVYNWVDEAVFSDTLSSREEQDRMPGCTDDRVTLLYAGNFGDYQQLDVAIKAAQVEELKDRLNLVLLGDGVARPRLEQLVRDGKYHNVRLLPRVDPETAASYSASADALLVSLQDLPFFEHTIPGKTQAALAIGKPVVMAVRGEAAELALCAGAAIACEPTLEGLQAAFQQLVDTPPEERARMGRQGREYYEAHLSLDMAASRIATILDLVAP